MHIIGPMRPESYFRAQAHNNAWANHRLLTACAILPANEVSAARTGFFPSIIHTLNHTLTVDWFYASALEGSSIGLAAFEPEIPFPGFADLDREQRAVDRRLITVCESLEAERLVDMVRGDRVQTERSDRTLLHLFQHQTHHRGQVHAMLSGTSVAPPQLDEFFCASDEDRTARQLDFEALGFSEDEIWR